MLERGTVGAMSQLKEDGGEPWAAEHYDAVSGASLDPRRVSHAMDEEVEFIDIKPLYTAVEWVENDTR